MIKFKDEADVIRMANESVYGLGGAVWTQDINRAMRVAKAVQTGRIWVIPIMLFRQGRLLEDINNLV